LALPFYAVTLFISAFILFLVQPIVAKILLPKLGGTPQVWNTCMVFFQMVLLAGYAYTHNVCTRLNRRQQLIVHALLLGVPLIVLVPIPFAFGGAGESPADNPHSIWGFLPPLGGNPIPATLTVLFSFVALPFFVVATSAPLLQKWFVYTGHPAAKDPYFLYGASNLGSMLSLPFYLVVVEPYARLMDQAWIYTFGYFGLIAFVLFCAGMVWNAKDTGIHIKVEPKPEPAPEPPASAAAPQTGITATAPSAATAVKSGQPGGKHGRGAAKATMPSVAIGHVPSDEMTFGRRFRWVMLAAIPSSLMLGVTTHITTDLSPMPFFWLIPLELYLLSFILVFARWPWVWTEQPHQYFVYAQPIFLWLMIMTDVWNLASSPEFIPFAIFAHVMGFFTTTMVCHGELAKDRPSPRHLTEFYLWMSVGGMLGGMFNGLVAPVIFKKLWELPLAIFAAALARPKMFDVGFLDNWIAGFTEGSSEQPAGKPGQKGKPHAPAPRTAASASESLVGTLDFVWPIGIGILAVILAFGLGDRFLGGRTETSAIVANIVIFGLPLALACVSFARPWRIGLAVGAVLLVHQIYLTAYDRGTIFSSRSYFGAISVKKTDTQFMWGGQTRIFSYNQLIHGHINHGMNYYIPDAKDRFNPDKDLSRLATTYYHREGPAGRVMEKYNWFPGPANTYLSDVRLPASLLGAMMGDAGVGNGLPMAALTSAWSEPPFATVGLGTGTMASYGRIYQHVHFYEIDNQIRQLSLPKESRLVGTWEKFKKAEAEMDPNRQIYFNYLKQAIERGSSVQVLMGDARLRMALPYQNHYVDEKTLEPRTEDHGGGPNNFYHMMVVDAFSSDAIPAHLLTKQAFQMYFTKLVPEGVLCVHTSNRFVDLPKVVAAVTSELRWKDEDGKERSYVHSVGHDANADAEEERGKGHFTSEWVMVARKSDYILKEGGDTEFLKEYKTKMEAKLKRAPPDYWHREPVNSRYVWTDDYYNLLSVVRFGFWSSRER
jgi:hypothetical protein